MTVNYSVIVNIHAKRTLKESTRFINVTECSSLASVKGHSNLPFSGPPCALCFFFFHFIVTLIIIVTLTVVLNGYLRICGVHYQIQNYGFLLRSPTQSMEFSMSNISSVIPDRQNLNGNSTINFVSSVRKMYIKPSIKSS